MSEFRMPSLGADMEAGTLVEWLKRPGDPVRHGDIVAVVETQKGAIEIEVFEDGVIDHLAVAPGETVPVGAILAVVRGEGEPAPAPSAPAPSAPAPPAAPVAPSTKVPAIKARAIKARAAEPMPGAVPRPSPRVGERVAISPLARCRAAELGVDPGRIAGTGPGGAVRLADIEAAAARGAAPTAAETPAPESRPRRRGFDPAAMRQAIAAAMTKSNREIPHYYLATTIDMAPATAWLAEANARRPVNERLLMGALLLKSAALALRDFPEFNGFWIDDGFRPGRGVHVGWAISLRGGGLMAPAIHDADAMSLDEIMQALRDVVGRARSGGIRGSEMTDATITVTSLGERGVETIYGVIYPPQVALVGFGRVFETPSLSDGTLKMRPMLNATLAADHRASDGHRGALFLAAIRDRLQQPGEL